MHDLQRRKLARRFALLDADGNGHIGQADYERVANRLADVYGIASGSDQHRMLHSVHLALWAQLGQLADRDRDGTVTEAEYVKAYADLLARGDSYDQLVAGPARGIIAMADRDRDGRLSRREYVDGMRGYNVSEHDGGVAFERLDRDGDGFITLDEMLVNVEEFYRSTDANAAGNWLFGPV